MRRLLAATLLLFFALQPARAQDKLVEAPPEASVAFANRTLTVLRVPFLGVSPERRARRAEVALREIIAMGGEGKVTVQIEPQGHALLVDDELVLILTPGDADPLRAQTLAQASQAARAALQRVMAETREGRDMQRLLRGALSALLATFVAAAVSVLTWRARRWASTRLTARVAHHVRHVRVAGAELLQTERLVASTGFALSALSWLVVAVIAYEWLSFVLSQFPYTRPWGEGLTAFLVGVVSNLGKGVLQALPDLVVAIVIFLMARGVIGMFRPFFSRLANGSTKGGWLDADTARPTQRLFSVAVGLFAVVMAYPYLPGAGSDAFKGMSVLIGLMVSVGGSSLFSQAASGMVLLYSRTLRVGEYVRIGEHEGTVTETGAFTTRIRTGLGEELTLPNALVLGTVTKNYSRVVQGSGFVVDTVVTIGYDTPWRQVEAMLIEAASHTLGVRTDPAPRVFQTALTDFYPEYRLVCLAGPSQPIQRAEVLSALHANIQDVFNKYGVQIMSPHYLGDPAMAKVVPPHGWYTAPAQDPKAQAKSGSA
jgi:small-conductance mechanosensitive channel